ncbi:MAG: HAD family hydrolase, partial [bacterium]|nr:HAD family hydrolase [bacterium]
TGIQTLRQMQGLVALVRDFGYVPPGRVLDEHGYKRIYNDALMEMVQRRIDKLERGELAAADFHIKNAAALLAALRERGVHLYLASGTDQADVEREAAALGYAGLFDGGIFGAIGDVTHEAKRVVLDRLLREIGPGATRELVTFGDGPVELRETCKRGGLAVGVASDEVRRWGFNPAKRPRLIQAGADLLIPDYSQLDALLVLLNLKD